MEEYERVPWIYSIDKTFHKVQGHTKLYVVYSVMGSRYGRDDDPCCFGTFDTYEEAYNWILEVGEIDG